ncbi:MAG: sulfurtransferase TusA family protein, partial [Candidatus Puniceispirillaceae bacterium]
MPSFDYRGLKCPLPVLKARRALAQLSAGEVIEFLADDPASPLDMSH